MPKRLTLNLIPEQREELERMRDRHPKPYLRERAPALLQIADGRSGRDVALHRLLKSGTLTRFMSGSGATKKREWKV
jgi:hypothetical protein